MEMYSLCHMFVMFASAASVDYWINKDVIDVQMLSFKKYCFSCREMSCYTLFTVLRLKSNWTGFGQ